MVLELKRGLVLEVYIWEILMCDVAVLSWLNKK